MKLTSKYQMSNWAFYQCCSGNDTSEMRSLITDYSYIFRYCIEVKDIKEMWSKIKEEWWAYYYCYSIKDRPEVRKHITNKDFLNLLEKRRK